MTSVYVIGQVLGGHGFPNGNRGLHCHWELITTPNWSREQGLTKGHTQVDSPKDGVEAVWSHPVDVHYSVSERVQGWPKFRLTVYQEDMFGRNEMVGYGFVHVPSEPGTHEIECACWRPLSSSWYDEVQVSAFLQQPAARRQGHLLPRLLPPAAAAAASVATAAAAAGRYCPTGSCPTGPAAQATAALFGCQTMPLVPCLRAGAGAAPCEPAGPRGALTVLPRGVQAFFVGGNPQLKSADMIATNIDRYKLRTRSSGTVRFQLSVLLKGGCPKPASAPPHLRLCHRACRGLGEGIPWRALLCSPGGQRVSPCADTAVAVERAAAAGQEGQELDSALVLSAVQGSRTTTSALRRPAPGSARVRSAWPGAAPLSDRPCTTVFVVSKECARLARPSQLCARIGGREQHGKEGEMVEQIVFTPPEPHRVLWEPLQTCAHRTPSDALGRAASPSSRPHGSVPVRLLFAGTRAQTAVGPCARSPWRALFHSVGSLGRGGFEDLEHDLGRGLGQVRRVERQRVAVGGVVRSLASRPGEPGDRVLGERHRVGSEALPPRAASQPAAAG